VHIGILNLMPTLEDTERQLIMALDNGVVQVELDFIYLDTKKVDDDKLKYYKDYYYSFSEIKNSNYDGVIVTGTPLEHIEYMNIDYIEELKEFFKYTKSHVHSTIFLCWASQFAMQYFYGVNRYNLPEKVSGLYEHYIVNASDLVKGFDDLFYIPQSRYCSLIESDIVNRKDLKLVSKSNESGVYIVENGDGSRIFLTGHAEYDLYTLDKEYRRDINKGLDILPPKNYYKDDNPDNTPLYKWHAHATLLYHNWLYYYVYPKSIN
jgi:homoserine O-succinyltransferase